MATLQNEFSWSISRDKLFKECLRKYYYNYYASWNGWDEQGSEHARLCYRLKQIVDLPIWAGKVVHRVIEGALTRFRHGHGMDQEAMRRMARNALNAEWKESAESLWLRHPKKYANLFEHYYKRTVTDEERAALRARVFDSLAAFESMGYAERLQMLGPEQWISVEELESFTIGGVNVWVVVDCAFRSGEEWVIYDWKTGQSPTEDAPLDQLICYAQFGCEKWGAPLEAIRVSPVYLAHGVAPEHKISAEQVIEFKDRAMRSAEAMRERLADPKRNIAREADFSRTENKALCRRCQFFEVCYGDRSLEPPGD